MTSTWNAKAFRYPRHGSVDVLIMHRFCGTGVEECTLAEIKDSDFQGSVCFHRSVGSFEHGTTSSSGHRRFLSG